METIQKLKELMDQASLDSKKLFEKNTFSRGREARKALSEIAKLCKVARQELLDQMKVAQEEKRKKKGG